MFDAAKRPSPKKQSQQEKDRGKGPASSSRTTLPPNLLWHQIATSVQTKRAVSAPDDPYEREADRVADQVMRMDTAAFTPQCAACSRSPDQHEVSRLQEAPTVPKTLKLSAISPRTVISRQAEGGSAPVQTGATAEREREVEAIEIGKTSYVVYQTKVRGGGSSAWLANNPGNLDYTDDTVAWGSYDGKKLAWGKHRFAIFPN